MRRSSRYVTFAVAVVVGWIAPVPARAQTSRAVRTSALEAAIAEVEAGRRTTPLIGEPADGGGATVTFLARRVGGLVPRIVSDVTGWGERADGTFDFTAGRMARVGRTDWYFLDARVVRRARVEYLIAYGGTDYRLDPHNPRHVEPPPASELVMPGYLPPQEFADPPVLPGGLMTEATVESRVLGRACRVIVYTPPGYRDDGDYPVAVFHDHNANVARTGSARVLDWLVTHQAIEPIVAVFVDPTARGHDYRVGAPMRTFLTDELLTWLSSRYGVTRSADRRAIIAISYGAADALDAAITSANGFDRLGLLIPGRRIGRADIDAITDGRNQRLRVAILAGQYDHANVGTARRVRQALADAGHAVRYTEVPEGHSPRTWLNHLRVVLVGLFGREPAPEASATRPPSRLRRCTDPRRRSHVARHLSGPDHVFR